LLKRKPKNKITKMELH